MESEESIRVWEEVSVVSLLGFFNWMVPREGFPSGKLADVGTLVAPPEYEFKSKFEPKSSELPFFERRDCVICCSWYWAKIFSGFSLRYRA